MVDSTNNSTCAEEPLIRLTQYSHAGGCGCKIAPNVLQEILANSTNASAGLLKGSGGFPNLLVGHDKSDDAAVVAIDENTAVVSTTDFFMPIVDDPETFGRIAATNAISDIYAMGARPIMAIAVLGWPIANVSPKIAGRVLDGGRMACAKAGIPLAGGHSIDSPEPIFGLAVTGTVPIKNIKRNSMAKPGDRLFLTKPLGVGVLTTAGKKGRLQEGHLDLAVKTMTTLNEIGIPLGELSGVHAMTDVTGFGLLGHLIEMAEGSNLTAHLDAASVPTLPHIREYISMGCAPGGTTRNHSSYGMKVDGLTDETMKGILCDPQTSGGLLVAVDPSSVDTVQRLMETTLGRRVQEIGFMAHHEGTSVKVKAA